MKKYERICLFERMRVSICVYVFICQWMRVGYVGQCLTSHYSYDYEQDISMHVFSVYYGYIFIILWHGKLYFCYKYSLFLILLSLQNIILHQGWYSLTFLFLEFSYSKNFLRILLDHGKFSKNKKILRIRASKLDGLNINFFPHLHIWLSEMIDIRSI